MFRKSLFTLVMLIVIVLSASCSPRQVSPTPATNMANPASVYCGQNGGRLDLRQDATGGVAGVCVFKKARHLP
jgi:putative hemolysin